jgi:DNA polymerase-4
LAFGVDRTRGTADAKTKRRGRTANLKLRFGNFRTITRAKKLSVATDVTQEIWQAADDLLTQALPEAHHGIRLLGVGVSGYSGDGFVQQTLFDDEGVNKQRKLDAVTDAVREKFGSKSLGRGSGLKHQARHQPDPNTED